MTSAIAGLVGDPSRQATYDRLIAEAITLVENRFTPICIYLSGSLTANLGSRESDLDIVALVEDDGVVEQTIDIEANGVTGDIELHGPASVSAKLAMVGRPTVADDYQHALEAQMWLRFTTRLLSGVPVFGESRFQAIRDGIDVERLNRCATMHFGLTAITYLGDTYGAVLDADLATAWDTSTYALRLCLQMALASTGDCYLNWKFLRRRLADNPATKPIFGLITAALDNPGGFPDDPEEVVRVVEARARLAGIFSDVVLLRDMGGAGVDLSQQITTALPATRRDPYTVSVLLDDCVLLGGRRGHFTSRATGLCYCLAYRSQTQAELVDTFAATTSIVDCDEFVANAVAFLETENYLVSRPTAGSPR
jgi:hypothetical protein